ncbi:1-aminocyclopropane-1-carboxylate deaminase/D-cysteine desulfhydrase [Sphingobacterium suaedae]|uniref:1-aminocyclopropane-1-carboxylate deaminase/D-cysteine desulfhydrase n=1 Tax=Sphingobacterium suaedae TaxID=1686402 RepID=A0ABW5KCM2_9SPHI
MLNFDFYSPEEEIHFPLYETRHVRVFVKRDDLIHPFISGNKWRKLKYPLHQAREQHKTLLVTFGGAWSNHLLATACAGAKFGFRTYGFVRGEDVENPVLAMCRLYGMKLHFVDRTTYRDKQNLVNTYFSDDPSAFFIDEGGYSALGARGCAEIVHELRRPYDYCFCAGGTGTTLAGLALGIQERNLSTQLHGVPVLKGADFLAKEIAHLSENSLPPTLHLNYHFGGYAKTKPALIAFIQAFVRHTGILIEPTYSGKLFFAVHDLIEQGKIPSGSNILLIHTGGLTGVLGTLHQFNKP